MDPTDPRIYLATFPIFIFILYKIIKYCTKPTDVLPRELLLQLSDVTYFSRNEIKRIYQIWRRIALTEKMNKFQNENDESLIEDLPKYDVNYLLSIENIKLIDAFEHNPYIEHLIRVFSSNNPEPNNSNNRLNFFGFLDILNALHPDASADLKASVAFKMFDYDEKGMTNELITKYDVKYLIQKLTANLATYTVQDNDFGPENKEILKLKDDDLEKIEAKKNIRDEKIDLLTKFTMQEIDIDNSNEIDCAEFRHIISRNSEFLNNFRLRFDLLEKKN